MFRASFLFLGILSFFKVLILGTISIERERERQVASLKRSGLDVHTSVTTGDAAVA